MEEAGPCRGGDQEDGRRLLQVGGRGREGPQIQPGQDLQVIS